MPTERFPLWLARQLDRRKWSQTEFASRIGTNSSVVSRWVRGERVPDTKSVDKIADVLGYDVDFVLALAGHRPAMEIDEDDLRAELHALIDAHPGPIAEDVIDAVRAVLALRRGR